MKSMRLAECWWECAVFVRTQVYIYLMKYKTNPQYNAILFEACSTVHSICRIGSWTGVERKWMENLLEVHVLKLKQYERKWKHILYCFCYCKHKHTHTRREEGERERESKRTSGKTRSFPFIEQYRDESLWCGFRTANAHIHTHIHIHVHSPQLHMCNDFLLYVIMITQVAFHENTLVHNLE